MALLNFSAPKRSSVVNYILMSMAGSLWMTLVSFDM